MRWLGIGCGFLAFLVFAGVGLSLSAILALLAPETDAARGFLNDVRRDDWASALARTSSDYQSRHASADLASRVAELPAHDGHAVAFLTSAEEIDEGHSRVEGALYGSAGETPIAFELSQAGGYWYVDLVVVQGEPLE
jgi:hypothetical protein